MARAQQVFKQATTPISSVQEGDLWIVPGAPDTVYVCSDASGTTPVWILFANATINPTAGVSSITGTALQITRSAPTGAVTLSLPAAITVPGSLTVTTRTGTPATFAMFDASGKLCEGDPV
jgi:hypothetical protein